MKTPVLNLLSPVLLLCSVLLLGTSPYTPWSSRPHATENTDSARSHYSMFLASSFVFACSKSTVAAYRGEDFPRAWAIPPLETVYLAHEDSYHYAVETDLGAAEWNATLPRGGATLYLGDDSRPFTLGLFHQLRCLNIVREVLVDIFNDPSPDAKIKRFDMIHHRMNHLRQSVICRGSVRLENVRAYIDPHLTVWDVTHTCKDWSAVYKAAEDNYNEYLKKALEHGVTVSDIDTQRFIHRDPHSCTS